MYNWGFEGFTPERLDVNKLNFFIYVTWQLFIKRKNQRKMSVTGRSIM